jgi:type IV pilus assembly protein PilC
MSTLLNAGVPMLNAFEILSTMSRNDVIKDSITRSKDLIEQGSSVSLGMMTTDFFPNLVIKMVQVGEDSGSLGEVLEKTAEHYERKVDSAITTLTTLLEPIMIITVGAIVLVVVIALYLPIFSLSTAIK